MANKSAAPPNLSKGSRMIAESLSRSAPATQGYRLHHSMLRIRNPDSSLQFYTDFMGMSLIFTLNTGPFLVYYLAYPGPEDQSPADIANSMSSRAGLLELVYVPPEYRPEGTENDVQVDKPSFTGFGHLGFYVPSVDEALKRAEVAGYKVVKALGDLSVTTLDLPESLSNIPFHPAILANFAQIGFITDPDG